MRRSKYVYSYSGKEKRREIRHSGEGAREWRRQVAALSKNSKQTIKTLKFPLELPQEATIDFDQAAKLYDVVEGVGRGSLIGLLCAAHLSGFRLFSSAAAAGSFRNRSLYPSKAFADALKKVFGVITTSRLKLTPAGLDLFVKTPPKTPKKKPMPFNRDSLKERLYKNWCGKKPDDRADEVLLEIAEGMADALCKTFSDWKSMNKDPRKALAAIEHYLKSKGKFPALPSPGSADNATGSSISFDADSMPIKIAASDEKEDFLVHRAVATAARVLRRENPEWDSKNPKALQDMFLSPLDNALSRLFGKGWRDLCEHPVERIAKDLGVPPKRIAAVQQLKKFAEAIPEPSFFYDPRKNSSKENYANFRRSVSGKLKSWIANYQNRLEELKKLSEDPPQIDDLPEGFQEERAAVLFRGTDIDDANSMSVLSKKFPSRYQNAREAIARLAGDSDDEPTYEDMTNLVRLAGEIDSFVGLVNQINNESEQRQDDALTETDQQFWGSLKITLPKNMKPLPRINQISGGSIDPEAEVRKIARQLNDLIRAQEEHFRGLEKWMREQNRNPNPFHAVIRMEEKRLREKHRETEKARELGLRWMVNRIAQQVRILSEINRRKAVDCLQPLFEQGAIEDNSIEGNEQKRASMGRANCNKFFYNHQGRIYQSPYSTSRHKPYALDLSKAEQQLENVQRWISEIEGELAKGDEYLAANFRDWLRLRSLYFSLRLQALPETGIPGKLARLRVSDEVAHVRPLLAMQLEPRTVSKSVCLRAFNIYQSKLNGICFQALRENFVVRAKFHRIGQDRLLYVAKTRPWNAPARLSQCNKPIASAIGKAVRDGSNAIDPRETLKRFSEKKFSEPDAKTVRAYFSQAPHDWFFPADFGSNIPECEGIGIEKTRDKLTSDKSASPGLRLRGPSSFKNQLDRALQAKVTVNEMMLIIDHRYYQQFVWKNGQVSLEIKPEKNPRLELAVPISDEEQRCQPDKGIFDRILAIDLGEKRIGYAVFDIPEWLGNDGIPQPMMDDNGDPTTGTVAVPSIRRLMTRVRVHRGRQQPNQKVQETYSKALEKYRENVIGDVCNRIETLCCRHGAFPVLESDIENFESGSRQLQTIYGSVLRRYAFSDVDAHKAKRAEHWFTDNKGGVWQHPYLSKYSYNEEGRKHNKKSTKPLKLFPGTSINPRGTSQTCSKCERNPFVALRKIESPALEANEKGEVNIGDGVILLQKKGRKLTPEETKKLRREKRRSQLEDYPHPLAVGLHKIEELRELMRFNQRRAPHSRQSKDTTQSRYFCLYTDCDYEGHADENAAINIGRRFFERIAREQSREERKSLTKEQKTD